MFDAIPHYKSISQRKIIKMIFFNKKLRIAVWRLKKMFFEIKEMTSDLSNGHFTLFYTKEILAVPLTDSLHIGQFFNLGAQSSQQAICPQGRKTIDTSLSKQTLQRVRRLLFLFSSINAVNSVNIII